MRCHVYLILLIRRGYSNRGNPHREQAIPDARSGTLAGEAVPRI
jgi:hypothetical protein